MNELLVVYYSRTGTSRQVAQQLARMAKGHLGEVVDKLPRVGLWGDMRCIVDALLHRTPRMRYAGPTPSHYRSIVLVAPVWMQHVAAPMRSFLRRGLPLPERLGIVCVTAREGGSRAVQEMADGAGSIPLTTLVLQQRKVRDGSATMELQRFLKDFARAGRCEQPVRSVELSAHVS